MKPWGILAFGIGPANFEGFVGIIITYASDNYIDLAERLESIGVHENSQNLSNKIARGSFSAVFMLQVLHVLGSDRPHII